MKYALALPILGLALAVSSPASAATLDGATAKSTAVVAQQTKCKEGEKWDENMKKCVKKEG